mmetsp:Transcript_19107/g.34774  ORF Transcript_19107/g.34774 Transcript_19107/m.34774 type:complete len:343 (+) Transcript_19107:343-1371(+)
MSRSPVRRKRGSTTSPSRTKNLSLTSASPDHGLKLITMPVLTSKSLEFSNKPSLKDFQVLRTIGVGSFARVKLVKKRGTSEVYVIKCIAKSVIVERRQVTNVNNEISFLRTCNHPHIARYYGSFQSKTHLFIVLEFVAGGELYSYIRSRNTLDVHSSRTYLAQVVSAISYIHSTGFVYRDLKPENILISQAGTLKLVDFGFVKKLDFGKKARSLCGTPEYMAPEIVAGTGHDFPSDWWSVGILLHELLMGFTPFTDNSPYDVYNKILRQDLFLPGDIDPAAKDLITKLLVKNPSNRLTEAAVKSHPFFEGFNWAALSTLTPPHLPQLSNAFDSSAFSHYADA